jgi:hypothetical protein
MILRFLKRRSLFLCSFAVTAMIAAPAAWAIGWTTVGYADIHMNSQPGLVVGTSQAVYSSQMRLYVQTHSPCGGTGQDGGYNFYFQYRYSDGSTYLSSNPQKICTAADTPKYWNFSGGNKWDVCGEVNPEFTDPASTCQRYSTT